MTGPEAEGPNLGTTPYSVTLVGPASRDTSRSLLRLRPFSGAAWRRVVIQIDVGSERCPSLEHAKVCLAAIQDLIKLSDGLLTDEVIAAIQGSLTVTRLETFRGPPRGKGGGGV